jgi:hypothetical protein
MMFLVEKYGFLLLFCALTLMGCATQSKRNSLNVRNDFFNQTFLQAVKNLSFDKIEPSELDASHLDLLGVVQLVLKSRFEQVESKVKRIISERNDSQFLAEYFRLLSFSLIFQSKWKELLPSSSYYFFDPDSVFLLARAFSQIEKDTIVFWKEADTLSFFTAPSGAIIVKVLVNGRARNFWFDTGTNYTIVSSKTAEDCNLPILSTEKSKAITLTNFRVDVIPTYIRSLKIGEIELLNQPCLIVDDFNLKLRLFASNISTEIYGILGWKSLQNCKFTIDYKNRILIIQKPRYEYRKEGNFFWSGVPIIIGKFDNVNLLFIFDIGAEKSLLTNNIFNKIDFQKVYTQTKKIGSVGGWKFNAGVVVPYLEFKIGTYKLTLENIQTIDIPKDYFFNIDGILGYDLIQKVKISFDIANSNFEILEVY